MKRSHEIFFRRSGRICHVVIFFLLIFLYGCSATRVSNSPHQIRGAQVPGQDDFNAMKAVTQSVTGKEITPEEMVYLAQEIDKNEETKTAVKAVTDSLQGTAAHYKYCPVDGQRYHPKFTTCPVHGIPLTEVGE